MRKSLCKSAYDVNAGYEVVKVYKEQKIYYKPFYIMEYRSKDEKTRSFKMEDKEKSPNDLLEPLIGQLSKTVEEENLFRNSLQNQLDENNDRNKNKSRKKN